MKRFRDLERFSNDDIEAAIGRNDSEELKLVPIIVALACPDCSTAQAVCIRLSSHPHSKVRGHAIMSLGHLARRFRVLDEAGVRPIVERALDDSDEYVRTHARSAAGEIHQFLHIAGHVYGGRIGLSSFNRLNGKRLKRL